MGAFCFLGGIFLTDKSFKTLDEQLDILKSRGLHINDEISAKNFLLNNNYYRVSGYSLTLRKNDQFFDNVSFEDIVDIYEFDHELRHILLKYIEVIEVNFKSIYAYEFSKVYGPDGYLNSSHFTDNQKYNNILQKSEHQKETSLPHEAYLKHFIQELHQNIPLWAYVDLFTIANISMLYAITDESIKDTIAKDYGLAMSNNSRILGKFMHSMTILRNLCAHGSRLFNRLFEQRPSLNRRERALLRCNPDGSVDNSHLFGFILIMKRLLDDEEYQALKKELISLTNRISFVKMRYYGFPDNWKEVI